MHYVIRRSVPAFAAAALALGLGFSGQSLAQGAKTVGGAPMYPSQNIIQNAVNSKDHTTLVTAVKAADLHSFPTPTRRYMHIDRKFLA